MEREVLRIDTIKPPMNFIDEVFKFDPRDIEITEGATISKYCLALGQYLIYMASQINKTRVEIYKKKRIIETTVNMNLTKELLKEYKTKAVARDIIIQSTTSLANLELEIEELSNELILIEGQDRNISELIAVFKRELTRRENELYHTRQERRG